MFYVGSRGVFCMWVSNAVYRFIHSNFVMRRIVLCSSMYSFSMPRHVISLKHVEHIV